VIVGIIVFGIRKIIGTAFEVQSFVGTCGQGGQHGFVDGMELVLMHSVIVLQRSPSHHPVPHLIHFEHPSNELQLL
jgi:hypothetical protein